MRTYVNVPQAFLEAMKPGLKATLSVVGKHETFPAEVFSTSNALATDSRTALVELQSDNADGKLWPGLVHRGPVPRAVRRADAAHPDDGAGLRQARHPGRAGRRRPQDRAALRGARPQPRAPTSR